MNTKVTGRKTVEQGRQDGDLPRGVHRGKLAGLTGEEREQALRAAGCSERRYDTMSEGLFDYDRYARSGFRGTQAVPTGDFADCLRRCTVAQLSEFVRGMGIGRLPNKRKQTLIDAITKHADKLPEAMEEELLAKINEIGLGPAGLGGDTTALAVNINTYATHIAGLPVAVNMCCHVNRHIVRTI